MDFSDFGLLLVVVTLPFQLIGYAAHSSLKTYRPRAARVAGMLLPAGAYLVVSLVLVVLAHKEERTSSSMFSGLVVVVAYILAAAGTTLNLVCGVALGLLVYRRRG